MTNLFKLVGSIFIHNDEANNNIDETNRKAKNMATEVGKAFDKVGEGMTKLGKALAPISAVCAGALTGAIKTASDFNDGMAKMSTMFDTTQTSVTDLSNEFLSLSNKIGLSASELAEAGYQALSAGVDVNNSVAFVQTAGNLAKAGFTTTATAVDVLTTAINAYSLSQDEAGSIANKLVRTQNLGKTTVDELASSMGKIIPTASAMNVNIDNLTSGYVALTKQGIATAESTTYMNSMLNELGDSGTTVGGLLKSKTGKSFQQLMADGNSLADVLKILKDDADASGTAFNELWGSAEAGKAGLALLNIGVDEFNATIETMASDTDDVSSAIDKLKTPSQKAKEALNQVKNSAITLGTTLLTALQPTIDKAVSGIEKLTSWFSNLDNGTQKMIGTVLAFGAVLSPVILIGGKIVSGIGSLITWIGSLSTSIASAGGIIAVLTNPITLVVTAIVGFIGAIVALYNTNEEFRNKVNEVWENIKEKIGGVIEAVQNIISVFVEIVQGIWGTWGDGITRVVSSVFDFIAGFISSALSVIQGIIQVITGLISGDWSKVWEGMKNILTGILNAIKTVIQSVLNGALGIISGILNKIQEKFRNIFTGAYNIVSSVIEKIKKVFNFQWSLPKLKLPHVSITGEFSLLPPRVPKFSIEWYKKAMDSPLLFTKPTLFDADPITGTARGAGEAGDEVMIGKDTMLNMIRSAVSSENSSMFNGVVNVLNSILSILQQYIPDMANSQLVLDTGVLVSEITPKVNDELGVIYNKKKRGV